MGFVTNEETFKLTSYDVLSLPHSVLRSRAKREYSSACPVCGGYDRFRYWPDVGNVWCRQCDLRGFVVDAPQSKRHLYPQEIIADKITTQTPEFHRWLEYHSTLFDHPEALAYWERALGSDYMFGVLAFGLGYCSNYQAYGPSVTMPVTLNGKTYLVYHRLLSRDKDKYRPEPHGMGGPLFNLDDSIRYNKLILTEGIKKAIRIWLEGYPAVSSVTGPIFDKSWDVFLRHKEIIVIYDPDEAGQEGASRVAGRLGATNITLPDKLDDFLNSGGDIGRYLGPPWRTT